MGTTLVVNPGSSSKKYALYSDGVLQLETRFENTESGFEGCLQVSGSQQVCQPIKQEEFDSAIERVAQEVTTFTASRRLAAVGEVVVRVVAPGTFFQSHATIDDAYVAELRKRELSAPLHVPTILREIVSIKKYFPDVALMAASDSAFHAELPARSREYSLPPADADRFDIHRFGYHGLSIASIVRRIHPLIGLDPEKMVVCHIGNGVSVTAVKSGRSVDCTMGFSPNTGLPMGSRGGDIDTAALLELMRVKNLRPAEADMYLSSSCGLQGLFGESDIRHLLERRAQTDTVAAHTLEVFAYSIQKAIAAATISLGGLEVLVLTATAAVRSSELRSLILGGLKHLGVEINQERNDFYVGKDGVVSVRNSPVKVVVMRTDEMGEMVRVAKELSTRNK